MKNFNYKLTSSVPVKTLVRIVLENPSLVQSNAETMSFMYMS